MADDYWGRRSAPTPPQIVTAEPELPSQFVCPITLEVMRQPVMTTTCGHHFEKAAILEHLSKSNCCPLDRCELWPHQIIDDRDLKSLITLFVSKMPSMAASARNSSNSIERGTSSPEGGLQATKSKYRPKEPSPVYEEKSYSKVPASLNTLERTNSSKNCLSRTSSSQSFKSFSMSPDRKSLGSGLPSPRMDFGNVGIAESPIFAPYVDSDAVRKCHSRSKLDMYDANSDQLKCTCGSDRIELKQSILAQLSYAPFASHVRKDEFVDWLDKVVSDNNLCRKHANEFSSLVMGMAHSHVPRSQLARVLSSQSWHTDQKGFNSACEGTESPDSKQKFADCRVIAPSRPKSGEVIWSTERREAPRATPKPKTTFSSISIAVEGARKENKRDRERHAH